jgi:hypothetical protein
MALVSIDIAPVLGISESYLMDTHVAEATFFYKGTSGQPVCFKDKGACKKDFAVATDPSEGCLKQ